jgi:hypothetical protein
MSDKIFINYRRGIEQGTVGRLYDQLESVFGRDRIFIDVDSILAGKDFAEEISERVAECDIFLAALGRGWADVQDEHGHRRLDDPNDWVRIEIESALRQEKHIIPIMVDGAEMPRAEKLPPSLAAFVRRNAVRLTHERFRADVQGLVAVIGKLRAEERARRQAEERLRRASDEQARIEREQAENARRDEEERRQRADAEEAQRRAEQALEARQAAEHAEAEKALKLGHEEEERLRRASDEQARIEREQAENARRDEEERRRSKKPPDVSAAEARHIPQEPAEVVPLKIQPRQGTSSKLMALAVLAIFILAGGSLALWRLHQSSPLNESLRPQEAAGEVENSEKHNIEVQEADLRVKEAQTELVRLGCYKGLVNGKFDDETKRSLGMYRINRGSSADDDGVTDSLLSDMKQQSVGFCAPDPPGASDAKAPRESIQSEPLPIKQSSARAKRQEKALPAHGGSRAGSSGRKEDLELNPARTHKTQRATVGREEPRPISRQIPSRSAGKLKPVVAVRREIHAPQPARSPARYAVPGFSPRITINPLGMGVGIGF